MVEPFWWPGNWFRLATLAVKEREKKTKPVKKETKNLQESRPNRQLLAGTDLLPRPFSSSEGPCRARRGVFCPGTAWKLLLQQHEEGVSGPTGQTKATQVFASGQA